MQYDFHLQLEDDDELFNIPTSPTLARQSPVRAPHLTINIKENSSGSKDLADDIDLVNIFKRLILLAIHQTCYFARKLPKQCDQMLE